MSLLSEKLNEMLYIGDQKRDFGLKTPKDIVRFDDINYGDDKQWQILDVYRQKNQDKKLPVIVNVHGGGWVYGTKETYQFYAMSLAQRGFVVINYTYRLAPKYKFPAALEDTNLVIKWIYKNYETYQMDVDHIFMVGDSAGAHYLSLYASICTHDSYKKQFKFKVPYGFKPKAIALNCGVYDIYEAFRNEETKILFGDLLGKSNLEDNLKLIDPLIYINHKYPPVFLMTANQDHLRSHAPKMKKVLEQNHITFTSKIYGDHDHLLYHVFHCDMKNKEGKKCNDDTAAFFKSMI
jgi:acetyl esterase/lipase